MGVARFVLGSANSALDQIWNDILNDPVSEGEKRRREQDIEIAISDSIQNLLQGGASATAAQIHVAIQRDVIARVIGFRMGGPNAVWPFNRN